MTLLFAHHVEAQHLPVLAALFGVGLSLGWRLAAAVLRAGRGS